MAESEKREGFRRLCIALKEGDRVFLFDGGTRPEDPELLSIFVQKTKRGSTRLSFECPRDVFLRWEKGPMHRSSGLLEDRTTDSPSLENPPPKRAPSE
jgi:hypothetical protein